jgi:ribonuclease III
MPFSKNRLSIISNWIYDKGGYRFQNVERLNLALTHSSARIQSTQNYERLEFLGDRVLGLLISEILFTSFPQANEGELSLRINQLVDAKTCAEIANELELPRLIRAGMDLKSAEGERLINVRADVMEALIAAIYLDGGIEAARGFVRKTWQNRIFDDAYARRDAKTELQEWAHRDATTVPIYKQISRTGPDHDPLFRISVSVAGYKEQVGVGKSKRIAEHNAAKSFLISRSIWPDDGIMSHE